MRRHRAERGYTLIEVLIASSIFVVVLIIGTTTFTTANRIRERAEALNLTTNTARSVLESLAQDVRGATGLRTSNGAFLALPFVLADGRDERNLQSGPYLKTTRFNPGDGEQGETVVREYFLEEDQDGNQMLMVSIQTFRGAGLADELSRELVPLLPAGLTVSPGGFTVSGRTHEHGVAQAFAQFVVTVKYVGDPRNAGLEQTVQTTVTSREYAE